MSGGGGLRLCGLAGRELTALALAEDVQEGAQGDGFFVGVGVRRGWQRLVHAVEDEDFDLRLGLVFLGSVVQGGDAAL